MSLLRPLLLWLMLLAIPVQGFAAASMVYCGIDAAQQGSQAQSVPAPPPMSAAAGHTDPAAAALAVMVDLAVDHADQAHDMSGKLPDSKHKCNVCAACCNLIGLAQALPFLATSISPQAHYSEPLTQRYAAPWHLLEKPPRAS